MDENEPAFAFTTVTLEGFENIDKYFAIIIIIIILIFLAFDHLANEIFLFRVEITFSLTRNEWKDARRKR